MILTSKGKHDLMFIESKLGYRDTTCEIEL